MDTLQSRTWMQNVAEFDKSGGISVDVYLCPNCRCEKLLWHLLCYVNSMLCEFNSMLCECAVWILYPATVKWRIFWNYYWLVLKAKTDSVDSLSLVFNALFTLRVALCCCKFWSFSEWNCCIELPVLNDVLTYLLSGDYKSSVFAIFLFWYCVLKCYI